MEKKLKEGIVGIFTDNRGKSKKDDEQLKAELYQQIGQLKVELDWLKKNQNNCIGEYRKVIDSQHSQIPIHRQCQLLGLSRSGYYYKPKGESAYNLQLMRLIDAEYTEHPFYGARKLTACSIVKGTRSM